MAHYQQYSKERLKLEYCLDVYVHIYIYKLESTALPFHVSLKYSSKDEEPLSPLHPPCCFSPPSVYSKVLRH